MKTKRNTPSYNKNELRIIRAYQASVANTSILYDKYLEGLHLILDNKEVPSDKVSDAMGLPRKQEIKVTSFWPYYQCFYKRPFELALLYCQKELWLLRVLIHPMENELLRRINIMDVDDDLIMTKYPWLISLNFNPQVC